MSPTLTAKTRTAPKTTKAKKRRTPTKTKTKTPAAITIPEPNDGPFPTGTNLDATKEVEELLQRMLKNPEGAAIAKATYDRISERVHNLRALRKAQNLTQQQLAANLGVNQAEISRLEHRTDLHITTLQRFIQATGGELHLTATYGNTQIPIQINPNK